MRDRRLVVLSLILLCPLVTYAQEPAPAPQPEPVKKVELPLPAFAKLGLEPDGRLVGRVTYIDPNQLTTVPVPRAVVTFIQNRRIIGQTRSDSEGVFTLRELTPHAVYSVFVSSPEWVGLGSIAIVSDTEKAAGDAGEPAAAEPGEAEAAPEAAADLRRQNELRFANLLLAAQNQPVPSAAPSSNAQMVFPVVPRSDFQVAARSGSLGGSGTVGPGLTGGIGAIGALGALGAAGGTGGSGTGAAAGAGAAGSGVGAAGLVGAGVAGATANNQGAASP